MAGSSGAQFGLRHVPAGFCSIGSVATAVGITSTNCVFGSFTGVISGQTLSVTALTGSILPGQPLVGTGVPAGTTIAGPVNTPTPGGTGIYSLRYPPGTSTLTVGSESMTTAGIPPTTIYAIICASSAAVNYRDDLTAPTATVGSGGQPINSGYCIGYDGTFSSLQFIQQSATAVVGISFYQ